MNSEIPKRVSISFDEDIYHELDMLTFERTGLSFADYSELYPDLAYNSIMELTSAMPKYTNSVTNTQEGIPITTEMDGASAVEASVLSSLAAVGIKASKLTAPVEVVVSIIRNSDDMTQQNKAPDIQKVIHLLVIPK
jgi:hypothetical protein